MNKNTFIIGIIAAVVSLLTLRYFYDYIAPILIGVVVSQLIRPLGQRLSTRTKLPKKPVCAVLLAALITVAAFTLFTVGAVVTREIGGLVGELGGIEAAITGAIDALTMRIPMLKMIDINSLFGALTSLIKPITAGLSGIAADAPMTVVGAFASAAIAWYLCSDYEKIDKMLLKLLGSRVYRRYANIRARIKATLSRLLYAYGLMFLCDCAVLAIGFTVLRQRYIIALTLICAALDILPAIGCGTVLLPWSAVMLFNGNRFTGFGLIILFAAVTVTRQITEPIFVGDRLGLHPIITTAAVYIGLKAAGAIGAVALPIILSVALNGEQKEAV